jgi:phenylacetate-CoA ligase
MRWLLNERVFDAFTLDPVKVERYVGELNRFRPTVILGYAGALWDFARMAQAAGLKVQAPRAVFASGEPLRDDMRPLIESVFGAPVFNRYGTRELTAVACECEAHQGMHYDPTRIWLEIAREDGSPSQPGEEGDVIATLLTNTAQGFIRYRIGDRATVAEPGPCPCGRTLPRIAGVTGRSVDTLTATDGRCVSPILFLQMIGGYRNRGVLSRMQLVQDRRDHVTVRVVLAPGQSAASTQETFGDIGEVLATGLGRDMQIDIDVVDDLPTSGSGKFRYVLNQIETQTDPRR